MAQYLLIHGKNPKLSSYEIECVYGNSVVFQFDLFSVVKLDGVTKADQDRLGGTVKIAEVFEDDVVDMVRLAVPEGKILFGVSVYGDGRRLSSILGDLKDELKRRSRSCRFVNKDFENISSGLLNKSRLLERGIDLVCCRDGKTEYWGKTVTYQDIDSYSKRDYGRPVRDAKVGMLPPKLAQMMINFSRPISGGKIVDPFCGFGTIPMEALLMGYSVVASDIKGRMVEATEKNCAWLRKEFKADLMMMAELLTFQHDATTAFRQELCEFYVVTEGYLGPLQTGFPSREKQDDIFSSLDKINRPFFQHISNAMTKGSRIVFSFPFFQSGSQLVLYPDDMVRRYLTSGFKAIKKNGSLLYSRRDQIVGRDIVVWERR